MAHPDITFNPAQSLAEASARMFALTSRRSSDSRGPRRALLALAESLDLEIDSNAVNAVVGGQIAEALKVPWKRGRDFEEYRVNLGGMNSLLFAAADHLKRLAYLPIVEHVKTLEQILATFPSFRPARGKQEAVDRMSDLASAPRDQLGPGGKEHLVTLVHLARRFAPYLLDVQQTKHSLAEALCGEFAVPWSPEAVSTAGTITKQGLNMILAGAERRAGLSSAAWATAEEEGKALVEALVAGLPPFWDGRESVQWMQENGSTRWFESEWAGWFFEEQVRAILNERYPTPALGGPNVRYGATDFDYASPTRVWDAKAHTAWSRDYPPDGSKPKRASSPFWLNDARAMTQCVEEQGLGFLILDGLASRDVEGTFRKWLVEFGAAHGKQPTGYQARTGKIRARKVDFTPLELRAIWVENMTEFDAGVAAGWLSLKDQPDWGAGTARRKRNPKYMGQPGKAAPWTVATHTWNQNTDRN